MRDPISSRAIRGLTALAAASLLAAAPSFAQDEEETIESLYRDAVEKNMSGDPVGASQTFDRLFDLSGGIDLLHEDFGGAAGGLLFDYGMTLLPQGRWEEAKKAFEDSINAEAYAVEVQTIVKAENPRENLARYQLGFCEARLGNHERALDLYDEYLENDPPAEELSQVRKSFQLRKGSSLMKLGRLNEGLEEINQLFENREEWQVGPQFLMQAILEVGLAWVDEAKAARGDAEALEKVSERAHGFLDRTQEYVNVEPLDQFRFGFVERLYMLGFQSTQSGLYSVALRYFSHIPTVDDIRTDIELRLARLPIGSGVPSQYQRLIDRLAEYESAEFHPDAETLRLVATCYERLGNLCAPRAIYRHLAEQYPGIETERRGQILHEAARLSSMVGDYSSAQYFGEKFKGELPEDHALGNNVASFMLQSLFTSGQHALVIQVAGDVRDQYELGDERRELADALLPMAYYATKENESAAGPFDEYAETYKESSNRPMVLYHRANNSLILGKMRTAAEQIEDFLKECPDTERFHQLALADLAVARFNLADYPAAISASDRLEAERPDAPEVARTLAIEGDAYAFMAESASSDKEEEIAEWRQKALEAYLAAADAGEKVLAGGAGEQEEYYRNVVAEGLWKAANMYYEDEKNEEGIALYDRFVADYGGTFWEPQISVFSLEPLEAAGRGDEGLEQVEKMINVLGNKPPEEQDVELLRQAIGSYADASVRIRGVDPTLAKLDDFPGLDPANQALLTWLKIQQVIVLQQSRSGMERDSAEWAAVESRIAGVFEDLQNFDKRRLAEFALQQIGLYLSRTENPFLAVPYFEELLNRQNPEADVFKAPAELAIAQIEMRSPDQAKIVSARERLRRIINQYKDEQLTPEAWLNLARLHMDQEEWRDASEALLTINKEKNWFRGEREKRAEAGFLLGLTLDELDDPVGANRAYLSVVSTYGKYIDWVTQAWEKYVGNSLSDIQAMPEGSAEEQAAKREREIALYRLYTKYLYMWQALTDEDAPSGALRRLRRDIVELRTELAITPEDQQAVEVELGIDGDSE